MPSRLSSEKISNKNRWPLLCLYFVTGSVIIGALQYSKSRIGSFDLGTVISWQWAFLAVFAVAAFISFIKRIRSRMFWEIVFTLTLFLGVWYLLLFILPMGFALAIASVLTLSEIFVRNVAVHNLLYTLGAAGVAIDLAGWLPPEALVAVLVVMTLYDMVAGAPGGPIAELAIVLISKGIVPGFIIVGRVRSLASSIDEAVHSNAALLGAGDVILPICLVARASFAGIWQPMVVLAGLLLGVLILAQRPAEHPRAALPALAVGASVPFLLLRLFAQV